MIRINTTNMTPYLPMFLWRPALQLSCGHGEVNSEGFGRFSKGRRSKKWKLLACPISIKDGTGRQLFKNMIAIKRRIENSKFISTWVFWYCVSQHIKTIRNMLLDFHCSTLTSSCYAHLHFVMKVISHSLIELRYISDWQRVNAWVKIHWSVLD